MSNKGQFWWNLSMVFGNLYGFKSVLKHWAVHRVFSFLSEIFVPISHLTILQKSCKLKFSYHYHFTCVQIKCCQKLLRLLHIHFWCWNFTHFLWGNHSKHDKKRVILNCIYSCTMWLKETKNHWSFMWNVL